MSNTNNNDAPAKKGPSPFKVFEKIEELVKQLSESNDLIYVRNRIQARIDALSPSPAPQRLQVPECDRDDQ